MSGLPKIGVAFSFPLPGLYSQADTKLFQNNPTIAAGDFLVWNPTGGGGSGAYENLATTPTVIGAGTGVLISLSATEMGAAYLVGSGILVKWADAAGAQWCSGGCTVLPSTRNLEDLAFPTTSGLSIDVTATGEVGIDWGNIAGQSSSATLSNTTIKTVSDAVTITPPATMATLANQTTLLNRIGAFTGTGVNTVLGFLKAMAQKAATLPSDIGGTYNVTTDSLEALRDLLASSTVVTAATLSNGSVTVLYTHTTWLINFTDLGNIAARTNLIFTLKSSREDPDASAIVQIKENQGLTVLDGAAVTELAPTRGVITVTDAVAGDGTIALAVADADDLSAYDGGLFFDIKMIGATVPAPKIEGTVRLQYPITRATS